MSNRQLTDTTIKIHDRALKALGLETALVMLGVANDLRSGVIESDKYSQWSYGDTVSNCGTPCCIWGHVCTRLGIFNFRDRVEAADNAQNNDNALVNLFCPNQATPKMGAKAIENYLIKGYDFPWEGVLRK